MERHVHPKLPNSAVPRGCTARTLYLILRHLLIGFGLLMMIICMICSSSDPSFKYCTEASLNISKGYKERVVHFPGPRLKYGRPRPSELSTFKRFLVFNLGCKDMSQIVQKVGDACKNYGFFQVINHSVSLEAVANRDYLRLHSYPLDKSFTIFEEAKLIKNNNYGAYKQKEIQVKLNEEKNNKAYKLWIHVCKLWLGVKNLCSENTMQQELYWLVKDIFPTKWRSIKMSTKPADNDPASSYTAPPSSVQENTNPASVDDSIHITIQIDEHSSSRETSSNGASSSGAGDGSCGGGAGDGLGGGGDSLGGRGSGGDGPGDGGDGPRGGGGGDGPGGGGGGDGPGDGGGGGDGPGGEGDGPGGRELQRRVVEGLLMFVVEVGQGLLTFMSEGNGDQTPYEKILFHIAVSCTYIGAIAGLLGLILTITNPGAAARVIVRIGYLAPALGFIGNIAMLLPENLMLWVFGIAGFICITVFAWATFRGGPV